MKICGAAVLVLLLVFAALGPAKWQVRSGLGWQFDHVAGYFAFTVMFSLAWRRPLVVGGILMASAMLLEALQACTSDRHCDLHAVFYSLGGALAGALFADLATRTLTQPKWRKWLAWAQRGWGPRITERYLFSKLQPACRFITLQLMRRAPGAVDVPVRG